MGSRNSRLCDETPFHLAPNRPKYSRPESSWACCLCESLRLTAVTVLSFHSNVQCELKCVTHSMRLIPGTELNPVFTRPSDLHIELPNCTGFPGIFGIGKLLHFSVRQGYKSYFNFPIIYMKRNKIYFLTAARKYFGLSGGRDRQYTHTPATQISIP